MSSLVDPLTWASLSVSECESAAALGIDAEGFNNLIYRFSEYILDRGFRILFGHDWRADGVMRIIATLAETRTSHYHEMLDGGLPRMLNLVPNEYSAISKYGIQATEESHGLLEVVSLHSLCAGSSELVLQILEHVRRKHFIQKISTQEVDQDPILRYWLLRDVLTDIGKQGIRVCLGGKTKGYSSMYSGIAEEAFFACSANMPLYLVGGFGGSTAEVASCFSSKPNRIFRDGNDGSPLENKQTIVGGNIVAMAERLGLPLDGLDSWFNNYTIAKLSKNNGLTCRENEHLFTATDMEVVFHLIERGIQRLISNRVIKPASPN